MTTQDYNEIGKRIFGDKCPADWGRDRPWRVERYDVPNFKKPKMKPTALRIVTNSGIRISVGERVLSLITDIVNEAR